MLRTQAVILMSALGLSCSAYGATFDGWTLNGSAQTIDAGNTLRLTTATNGLAGSAWAPTDVSLQNDFSIAFSFKIHGGTEADGLTLTLQNANEGKSALGNGGGGLGYEGIGNSVAFIYDTWENGFKTDLAPGNNTAVGFLGNVSDPFSGNDFSHSVSVNGGSLRGAELFSWVDYSAANNELLMYLNDTPTKPATAVQNLGTAALANLFGSSNLHVGFTAGTGGSNDNHDILSVQVTTVPVPAALWLFGSALMGLWSWQRRTTSTV